MTEQLQSRRFLLLYALAWAGGAIAYIPLLTVLLPGRVSQLAGENQAAAWLATIAFCGAIAASLSNIAAGLLSDVWQRRRWPVMIGLAAYAILTPLFALAQSLAQFVALIVAWQAALNLMLAPLSAWAADNIPDRQKGAFGGLLAFAPATGAAAGAVATLPWLTDMSGRLALIVLLVAGAVLPVIVVGRPRAISTLRASQRSSSSSPGAKSGAARMWLARLLVQISEATLFAYLFLWLRSLDPAFDEGSVARLFLLMLALGVPVSIALGRWSDRRGRPMLPLRLGATVAAAGLAGMALAPSTGLALISYGVFTLATAVFLSLHGGQLLRVLPTPSRRGRDLGIFNLTNTVPSLVMPGLAIALVPQLGFTALFAVLALLASLAPLVLPTR